MTAINVESGVPMPRASGEVDKAQGRFVVLLFNYASAGGSAGPVWASVHSRDLSTDPITECPALNNKPEESERVYFDTRDHALSFAQHEANDDVRDCARCRHIR
jgi:hypothetical protein